MNEQHRLSSIRIKGYRPFDDIEVRLEPLQVIAGANGSGKTSLFEFLSFIRDACYHEIPPEIIMGTTGRQIFHKPGPDKFWWSAEIENDQKTPLCYEGELLGPVGSAKIAYERVASRERPAERNSSEHIYLDFKNGEGCVRYPGKGKDKRKKWDLRKPNQLGLGAITDSSLVTLFNLREYIRNWRFYDSFHINDEKIRKSVPTSQEPMLQEDAGNLSAVLFNLMTEHPESFEELKFAISSAVPGFNGLNVKARGGPGEVIAFWREKACDTELSLADLSDGTLRFIAWATLCVMPSPPSLICIDDPDLGVHPRTLPVLASLFQEASLRTQIILATHASYFLSRFDLKNIAVMRKISGKSLFLKAGDSQTLLDNLKDFGDDELEKMHRTDELEALA